ncbi:glycosyltransferase family 2 protein [Mangrovimonas sp. YM274]|uniref:glycosyltransferase family 2 protein n=1 Tax=Mangrovimonas sp. YM274 TaxID=3070660 RepID=UPI0027DCE885|nr:glycosyltransferase family 2 protein [Mangrovimonas sp. YM274]WMI69839.1 glycosyltransferase family 2 protein [Mangrovimonas sp. YM274]
MSKLISIITVNLNNASGLLKTIESVKGQEFLNFEHIVIDGGSSDGSKELIEREKKYIALWLSEPDTGIYNAMNKGIRLATAKYILFLNSGDIFYTTRALFHFAESIALGNDKDFLFGDIAVAARQEYIKTYPDTLDFLYFIKDTLPHPATLVKRSCFDKLMYDERFKIVSDWKFFMLGIIKFKFSYMHIPEVISKFHLDGISSNMPNLVENERAMVLHEDFFWKMKAVKIRSTLKAKLHQVKKKLKRISILKEVSQ